MDSVLVNAKENKRTSTLDHILTLTDDANAITDDATAILDDAKGLISARHQALPPQKYNAQKSRIKHVDTILSVFKNFTIIFVIFFQTLFDSKCTEVTESAGLSNLYNDKPKCPTRLKTVLKVEDKSVMTLPSFN